MMMPANFSAVAENELTYVVGGASLADYLAPAMKAANWQNFNTNLINLVGNAYLNKYTTGLLNTVFGGHYMPGDVTGSIVNGLSSIWTANKEYGDAKGWGLLRAMSNVGAQVVGGLAAIYTLGDSKIGLKLTDAAARGENYAVTLPQV